MACSSLTSGSALDGLVGTREQHRSHRLAGRRRDRLARLPRARRSEPPELTRASPPEVPQAVNATERPSRVAATSRRVRDRAAMGSSITFHRPGTLLLKHRARDPRSGQRAGRSSEGRRG